MVGATNNTRQGGRGNAGGDRRNRQSAPVEKRPDNSAESTLLGTPIIAEINNDTANRDLAFERVRPEHFSDPAYGRIWAVMKALRDRGEPITTVRVANAARPAVPDAGAIVYEAVSGDCRAVTTRHTAYFAELVTDAADKRRLRSILHDASRDLESLSPSDSSMRMQNALNVLAADRESRKSDRTSMFDHFERSVIDRERQMCFEVASHGSRLREVEIGRELVTLIGAPPACGKTALAMQLVVDALRAPGQSDLKVLVANCEMSPQALLLRQLARLTGVSHSWLRRRDFPDSATSRIQAGLDALRELTPRLEFLQPPFTLENLAERATAFEADIVVLDYMQRFDHADRSHDPRSQCTAAMDICRRLASQGRSVIGISAVNRGGYAPQTAGLASFRESSELEFGADSAWILQADPDDRCAINLKCVKNRAGEITEIPLRFNGSSQSFADDRSAEIWTGGFPDE
ncbi:MAG: hypothetical protein C0485_04340 [Pirellula sp.]|nr:hypothetical protein [Pirellula sp.]